MIVDDIQCYVNLEKFRMDDPIKPVDKSCEAYDLLLQENYSLQKKNDLLQNEIVHLKEDNDILSKQTEDIKSMEIERSALKMKISQLELKYHLVTEDFKQFKDECEKKIPEEVSELPQLSVQNKLDDTIINKLQEYEDLIENLKFENNKLNLSNKEDEIKIAELVQKELAVKEELEEVKNILESKTKQLEEIKVLADQLKDDKVLLQSELDILKSAPSDANARGNSLFGEIEDKRIAMSSKFKILHNKYTELKKYCIKKNNDYQLLKADLCALRVKWNNLMEEEPKADTRFKHALQNRIKDLMEQVRELQKRPENPQIVTLNAQNLSWALGFIDKAREESVSLRNEIERLSFCQLATEEVLRSKSSEIQKLKEETFELKAENMKLALNIQIQTTNNANNEINSSPKLSESNKENKPDVNKTRKVQFTE